MRRLRRSLRSAYHVLLVAWAVALGASLGLGSALYAVENGFPFGERRIQAWTTWPTVGAPDADPYARAIVARTGDVPLALGEGIAFHAFVDDDGRPLDAACDYAIGGDAPAARGWTLTLHDMEGALLSTPQRRSGLASGEILRAEDGRFSIALSRRPRTGDWIQLPERGRFQAVLRLYDSPVSGAIGWVAPGALPAVTRLACAGASS